MLQSAIAPAHGGIRGQVPAAACSVGKADIRSKDDELEGSWLAGGGQQADAYELYCDAECAGT